MTVWVCYYPAGNTSDTKRLDDSGASYTLGHDPLGHDLQQHCLRVLFGIIAKLCLDHSVSMRFM